MKMMMRSSSASGSMITGFLIIVIFFAWDATPCIRNHDTSSTCMNFTFPCCYCGALCRSDGVCCVPEGNPCVFSSDCCDGAECINGFCAPCADALTNCINNLDTTATCLSAADCCSCQADCRGTVCCVPEGKACASSGDCCGIVECSDGVCSACANSSGTLSSYCNSDADCCPGNQCNYAGLCFAS